MKLRESLADIIHMSPITSNLFLFLLLTWICVRTAVLALVGARQGQASLFPTHPSSRQSSFSSAIPGHCLLSQRCSCPSCKSSSSSQGFGFKSQCSALCKAPAESSMGISGSPQPSGCRRVFCQFCISLLWCVSVPAWRSGISAGTRPLHAPVVKIYEVIFSRSKALFKLCAVIYW